MYLNHIFREILINFESLFSYRYGYGYLGLGQVFPITGTTLPLNDINKIEDLFESSNELNSQLKFRIDIEPEKRHFEVIIEKRDEFKNVFVCDLTLNGCEGKAVVIIDDNSQEVITSVNEIKPKNEKLENLVLKIGDENSDEVIYSGGKGASLASLSELSKSNGIKFLVPRGVIVTTNSYEFLLKQNKLIKDKIDSLQEIAGFVKK